MLWTRTTRQTDRFRSKIESAGSLFKLRANRESTPVYLTERPSIREMLFILHQSLFFQGDALHVQKEETKEGESYSP